MSTTIHPRFHPQEDLLLSHGSNDENPCVGLLLDTHAALCEECRETFADMDAIGAHLLEADKPLEMSVGFRERALAMASTPERVAAPQPRPKGLVAATVESVLAICKAGSAAPWSWRAPGVHEVHLPLAWNGIDVTVARLRSGLYVPRHTHTGRELTLVLSGGLADEVGTYHAGDVADYDASVSHAQWVPRGEDCYCLVVNEDHLVPQSLVARLAARLFGA